MKTTAFLLAAVLVSLAAPAFATHPNELCTIDIDVSAAAKSAGADPSEARIVFVFSGGIANMTDMNPRQPEVVSRPAQGPWIYKTEVNSSLYYRTLSAVYVESKLYRPEDGRPVWSVKIERPSSSEQKKDGQIYCVQYAS